MPSRCSDLPLKCVALYKNNLALHQRAALQQDSKGSLTQLDSSVRYQLRLPTECSQLFLSTLNCVAKNADITVKHGGSLAPHAAKASTPQQKRAQLLKAKSQCIQLHEGFGAFLKSVLGAEVDVMYVRELQLSGIEPEKSTTSSMFYDKSSAALGRIKVEGDHGDATTTVQGKIIMVEDDMFSMADAAKPCNTYSMLYLAKSAGMEAGSTLEVIKISMLAIQSIAFKDHHLQDALKLRMSMASEAYDVGPEELRTDDARDTREAIEFVVAQEKAGDDSTISSPLEISYIERCGTSWLCNYRLSLPPSATDSTPDHTVELAMFGIVNNSTEEDWDDVYLKFVTKELNVLNAQCGVTGAKGDIFVKMMSGKTLTVPLTDCYVRQVKQQIEKLIRASPSDQKLLFAGKQLQDHIPIKDYNIQRDATLHLLLRLRSGGVQHRKMQDQLATGVNEADDSGKAKTDDFEQMDVASNTLQGGRDSSVVYSVNHPVSIGSGQTATVSIGTYGMKGTPVLVYDYKMNQLNPLKAVRLTNNLQGNMVLAPGRVSVFAENDGFSGQSQWAPMLPGEEQLIFYGEDARSSVLRSLEQDSEELVEVLVKPGSGITLVMNKVRVFSYVVTNHSDQAIASFYIDHETENHLYAILPNDRAVKQAVGWARYELALEPHEDVSIEVKEEASCQYDRTRRDQLQDLLRDPDRFGGPRFKEFMQKDPEIESMMRVLVLRDNQIKILRVLCDPEVLNVRALKNAVGEDEDGSLDTAIVEKSKAPTMDQARIPKSLFDSAFRILKWHHERDNVMLRQRRLLETEIIKLDQDQGRIRDNVKTMKDVGSGSSNKLLERYMNDMDRMEDALHQKREEIVKLEDKILSQQQEVEEELYETVVGEAKQSLISIGEALQIPSHRASPNFALAKFSLPTSLLEDMEAKRTSTGVHTEYLKSAKAVEEEEEEDDMDMDFDLFG